MRYMLPSLPLSDFTEDVFAKILETYARVAGIMDPCKTGLDPRNDIEGIRVDLSNHLFWDFRFGSSLTTHSKLFIHPISKSGCLHVGFDFDPNTADDSHPRAVTMRGNFHREVQEYIETLKKD